MIAEVTMARAPLFGDTPGEANPRPFLGGRHPYDSSWILALSGWRRYTIDADRQFPPGSIRQILPGWAKMLVLPPFTLADLGPRGCDCGPLSYHRALMVTHQGCPQTPGGRIRALGFARMGARGRRRGPIPAMCQYQGSPVSVLFEFTNAPSRLDHGFNLAFPEQVNRSATRQVGGGIH